MLDHIIDGRVLYPFTGHMVLAWKTISKLNGVDFLKTPVILEEIRVYSATIVTKPSEKFNSYVHAYIWFLDKLLESNFVKICL